MSRAGEKEDGKFSGDENSRGEGGYTLGTVAAWGGHFSRLGFSSGTSGYRSVLGRSSKASHETR